MVVAESNKMMDLNLIENPFQIDFDFQDMASDLKVLMGLVGFPEDFHGFIAGIIIFVWGVRSVIFLRCSLQFHKEWVNSNSYYYCCCSRWRR